MHNIKLILIFENNLKVIIMTTPTPQAKANNSTLSLKIEHAFQYYDSDFFNVLMELKGVFIDECEHIADSTQKHVPYLAAQSWKECIEKIHFFNTFFWFLSDLIQIIEYNPTTKQEVLENRFMMYFNGHEQAKIEKFISEFKHYCDGVIRRHARLAERDREQNKPSLHCGAYKLYAPTAAVFNGIMDTLMALAYGKTKAK